jgi:hypothetical protein
VNLDSQQAMVLPSKLNDSCKNNSAEGKINNNNLELNLCFVLPKTSLEGGGGGGGGGGGPDRKSH